MKPITILYGTETGNSEYCADELGDFLLNWNLENRVLDMGKYEHAELPSEEYLFIITSTYGHGEPPENAYLLLEHLMKDRPSLSGVRFAVLSLGDSCYPLFAQCGKDFDRILGELGGLRAFDRIDCDGDYDVQLAIFQGKVLALFQRDVKSAV